MKGKVRIQSYPDHTMRIKINNARLYMMGEENIFANGFKKHDSRRIRFGQRIHVNRSFEQMVGLISQTVKA